MPRIFPIGGGKGGSGKSFITANLGVLLAKKGKKVALIDLDLGGANLHTFFGLRHIPTDLNDFLNKRVRNLSETAVPTGITNLSLISSLNCPIEVSNLFHTQKIKLLKAIQKLPDDYVLIDLGAGTNFNTLDFFLTSNEGLFVITPEPTSIENTFRFIKAVYLRKVKQLLKQKEYNRLVQDFMRITSQDDVRSSSDIADVVEFIIEQDQTHGSILRQRLSEFQLKFVLNQFRKQTDSTLGDKIERVCNRHFYSRFQFLENIEYDDRVYDSIYLKEIYIAKYPYTATATALQNISAKILGPSAGALPVQDLTELMRSA
ncbi:MAG: MinD/ParA family protein [Desulfobacteraceae bacterium]|nr:MAG: MinD/ParA family protein [Desulfobacteraceae bacterium]